MKIGKTGGILIGIVILVGVVYAIAPETFDDIRPASQTTPTQDVTVVVPASGFQTYGENLNVSTKTWNTLNQTQYGDDVEIDTVCYERVGSNVADWIHLDSASEAETGDMNISVRRGSVDASGTVLDSGLTEMWCEINLETGLTFYVDKDKTIKNNRDISTAIWDDINDDGDDTYIFQINLIGIDPTIDQEATKTYNWYVYGEQAEDVLVDTSTASATAIGTGSQTATQL